MRNIPPLYHWAPVLMRWSILEHGLLATCPHRDGTLVVCLGTDPLSAWALSGDLREPGIWDLFQVSVADTPVHRVKHWGRWAEYRIPRDIEAQGISHVGTRIVAPSE
jgi:hypothetical protein